LSVLAREKEMMSNAQTGANNETVLKLNKQIEALHTEIANALKINTGKDSKIEQLEQNNHTLQDEVADLKFRSSDNKPKKRYGLYIVFLVVAVIVGGLAYSIGYDEGKASQPRESAELLNLRIANSNLQTEITTLRNRQGTTNNPAQQNEITRLTTENNQLKTENATLRNQQSGSSNNSALQRDIDQLRQQIRQKDATINEQRTRITELERQNKILIYRM
jgi:cell division protein FtsB